MLERINYNELKTIDVVEFEFYHNVKENYFLVMSYFTNAQNNNTTMCQWHLATMSEDGKTFTTINRLGSCHIEDEDNTESWKRDAELLVEKQLNTEGAV